MNKKWDKSLGHLVNSVGVSNNGSLVAAGTYYFPYPHAPSQSTQGTFGTYRLDSADGSIIWKDEYVGNEGVYAVAASADGQFVASGGLLTGGKHGANPAVTKGLVRAFDATGNRLLDYSGLNARVNFVALSQDGSILAGVTLDGQLFVFSRSGTFPAAPAFPIASGPRLDMVAVHPFGRWLVACGRQGKVHLVTLNAGAVAGVFTWTAPAPRDFLACAIAATSNAFVVGGNNKVYLFTKDSMTNGPHPQFVDQFDTPNGHTSQDVRWVATSADSRVISVAQNQGNDDKGLLLRLSNQSGSLTQVGQPIQLRHNPNSTSIDSAGTFITVADGHPIGTEGVYYLFRASDGSKVSDFVLPEMSWPMVISGDATVACAGSDNGNVYYFQI